MPRLRALWVGLAAATALTIAPIGFGPLPLPIGATVADAATATVDIKIFFDPLAKHGVWVKHSKFRYVFCPRVDAKWRPYSNGHWIYLKKYGWYFASDEPFAWAVYHYGRWFKDQRIGWCWVPGNAWAGAWVAWRRSNDFIGWAPLEPSREGFAIDVDINTAEPPQPDWIFVPPKRFLEPKLTVVVQFGDEHPDAFQKTEFVGPVVVQNNIVVNNIIDVNFIQQQTNTKIVEVEPKPVDNPDQTAADASGNTIALFAPQIAPPKQDEAPPNAVDEDKAKDQLGNPSEQPSASSEQPASSASEQPSASSAQPASSSEQPASSSGQPSASSSEQSSSAASSEQPASSSVVSSEQAPASSSEAAPASSEQPQASSEQAPASSSEAAPASSEQPQASSSAPPASSEAASASSEQAQPSSEEAQPSSEEQQASSLECPKGYEIVDGKCVPIESKAPAQSEAPADQAPAESSAAQ
jgi:hypothetical protein